ncbi:hypothetical protein DITRI_Ditri19aG0045200 [Diplodiscus trichospermus]
MTKLHIKVAIFLLILTINYGSSTPPTKEKSSLISDGLDQTAGEFPLLELDLPTTTVTCEPIYGFLPCTMKLWGHLFLLVFYECLLFLSEKFISDGSILFFEMFGTHLFGARLFHIIRMFPRAILVLVSGVSASGEATQTMAEISMSLLAGSTIMMLTLIWGSVIAFGSYDLSETSSSNPENANTSIPSNANTKKPFSLTGHGVRTDTKARRSAIIMLMSMIPFLILALSKLVTSATAIRLAVLISLIITLSLLFSYCVSQTNLLHTLLSPNGSPDKHEIKEFFARIDKNCDSIISSAELRAFICEIQIEEFDLDKEDIEKKIMEELDDSEDSTINETEFISGLSIWLKKANNDENYHAQEENRLFQRRPKKRSTDKSWWNYTKAAFLITLGTTAIVLITNPLIQTLVNFSNSVHIPSFVVSYVVIPFALSVRLAFRAITSARYKIENALSQTISQIYGAVFMNNVVGLVMFLAIVYLRDISWGMTDEVLVVLIICTAMGLFATFTTKIHFWTSILVLLLYPISLLLLYVLTYGFVWS